MHDSRQFKDFIGGLQGFVMIWTHAARALVAQGLLTMAHGLYWSAFIAWMECLSFVKCSIAGCLKQRSIYQGGASLVLKYFSLILLHSV